MSSIRYAIIRMHPRPETGERLNIGVIFGVGGELEVYVPKSWRRIEAAFGSELTRLAKEFVNEIASGESSERDSLEGILASFLDKGGAFEFSELKPIGTMLGPLHRSQIATDLIGPARLQTQPLTLPNILPLAELQAEVKGAFLVQLEVADDRKVREAKAILPKKRAKPSAKTDATRA